MRLKASWTVRAGLVPYEPLPQFTKQWEYTGEQYERDQAIKEPNVHAEFSRLRALAMDYSLQVSEPRLNNWAAIDFVWLPRSSQESSRILENLAQPSFSPGADYGAIRFGAEQPFFELQASYPTTETQSVIHG